MSYQTGFIFKQVGEFIERQNVLVRVSDIENLDTIASVTTMQFN